jgi:hypothetical protein
MWFGKYRVLHVVAFVQYKKDDARDHLHMKKTLSLLSDDVLKRRAQFCSLAERSETGLAIYELPQDCLHEIEAVKRESTTRQRFDNRFVIPSLVCETSLLMYSSIKGYYGFARIGMKELLSQLPEPLITLCEEQNYILCLEPDLFPDGTKNCLAFDASIHLLEVRIWILRRPAALLNKKRSSSNLVHQQSDDNLCILCFERQADTVAEPCLCAVVCSVCSKKLEATNDKKTCIRCRREIKMILYPDGNTKTFP